MSYAWRDLGDGVKVRVGVCLNCGIAPSAPDDCGMPTENCPHFGINGCKKIMRQLNDVDLTKCYECGRPHRLADEDAGSDREQARLCVKCFLITK